ncbi:hypothetical protein CBW16_11620 [Flavobacteriaceae bacterium JJC]|nr:hypothetical protein CBW16_11620 [Flavobacteriaceae bacterium JJC]
MKNLIKVWPLSISLFFAVLFSYAAVSKATGFKNFRDQLGQSPGLNGYGEPVAYGVIALQTATVILLCYRPFRLWGLWSAFGILAVSAGYIGTILMYSNNLPCTCIGLFEKMTWKENLVLNIGLMITAFTGMIAMRAEDQN